jgi:hypothetical protein
MTVFFYLFGNQPFNGFVCQPELGNQYKLSVHLLYIKLHLSFIMVSLVGSVG